MPYGRLLINVFGMSVGTPLDRAVIRISEGGSNRILAETETDGSGKSDVLDLPCPPGEYLAGGHNKGKRTGDHLNYIKQGIHGMVQE